MHEKSVPRAGHFWLPIPIPGAQGGGTRHAFRGRRWQGEDALTAVCGAHLALAAPSEVDWIAFRTCTACNTALKAEQQPEFSDPVRR